MACDAGETFPSLVIDIKKYYKPDGKTSGFRVVGNYNILCSRKL
jgi:hypothetical protein